MNLTAIRQISSQTFKDSIRAKWLLVFSAVYFFMAINIPILIVLGAVGAVAAGDIGANPVQAYLTTFVSFAYPYIPLLTLPMGAAIIVDERESGTLQYIMSNPISKSDFLLGRLIGMLVATTLVIMFGFGIATVFVYGTDYSLYPPLILSSLAAAALNWIVLGLAMIISVMSKRKSTAIGIAIFVWLGLTVITNLGELAVYVNLKAGAWASMLPALLNPIDTAQNYAVLALGNDLRSFSSTGMISTYLLGANTGLVLGSVLTAWLVGVICICFLIFRHQDVI